MILYGYTGALFCLEVPNWAPKEAIPLPPGAIELRENGIVNLRRGKKDLCFNYLGGLDENNSVEYSTPQSLYLDGVMYKAAGTRCYPLPEDLSGEVQVNSDYLERSMPDNRLYQGPPLNSYEMEDKLGTAKKRYFAYPFINFGD